MDGNGVFVGRIGGWRGRRKFGHGGEEHTMTTTGLEAGSERALPRAALA